MNKYLLTFSLFISSITFSQTAIISNKSHSGDVSKVTSEPDNFGERMPEGMNYNTAPLHFRIEEMVFRIDAHCYSYYHLNKDSLLQIDTLCNERFFEKNGYTKEAFESHYGQEIQIYGFPTQEEEKKNDRPLNDSNFWINGNPFQNGTTGFFGFIILTYLLYLIPPVFKKR